MTEVCMSANIFHNIIESGFIIKVALIRLTLQFSDSHKHNRVYFLRHFIPSLGAVY